MQDIIDIKEVIDQELAKVRNGEPIEYSEQEEDQAEQELTAKLAEKQQSYKAFDEIQSQFQQIEAIESRVNEKVDQLKKQLYKEEEELYLSMNQGEDQELNFDAVKSRYKITKYDMSELDKQIEEKVKLEHPELFQ